jgi:DNA-binding XRE family transcriptional regulator
MDDETIRRGRFAVRLAELRRDSGLSFDALGVEIGAAGETIRRWEQGAYAPRSKSVVTKLEEALGARTGELWALLKGYEIPAMPTPTSGSSMRSSVSCRSCGRRSKSCGLDRTASLAELVEDPLQESRCVKRRRVIHAGPPWPFRRGSPGGVLALGRRCPAGEV